MRLLLIPLLLILLLSCKDHTPPPTTMGPQMCRDELFFLPQYQYIACTSPEARIVDFKVHWVMCVCPNFSTFQAVL